MSLPRVLEPEYMDTPDDARDYDSMDHSTVNRLFVEDLLAVCPSPGLVLDLGTGTALIPIELCRRELHCQILAVDAAQEMLVLGQQNIAAAGLSDRIQLLQGDAKQLVLASATFDTVMSNSILHHIPEPGDVLAEAVRTTRVGGRLFFRDLLRPHDLVSLERLVETYASGANAHQRSLFSASLHAAFTLEEIQSLVAKLGFSRHTVKATSDRYWTWSGVKSLL
jgi:ubiquinone/menaquinone biosynthesis C-methylase UbiE